MAWVKKGARRLRGLAWRGLPRTRLRPHEIGSSKTGSSTTVWFSIRECKGGCGGRSSIGMQHYGLDPRQPRPDDAQWTGAEIKSCCRLASLLDVPLVQAAQNVVPVAVTAGDKIESLRQWASGRCLSADRAGVYSRSEGVSGGRVRRVVREPGVN